MPDLCLRLATRWANGDGVLVTARGSAGDRRSVHGFHADEERRKKALSTVLLWLLLLFLR